MESMYLPPVTTGPWSPAWSPDGQRIAFSMQGSIWVAPAGGGEAAQITSGPGYDGEPSWSPDGRRIAFTRDTGHTLEIWVANADGSDPRQITRGEAISVNPHWSPQGDSILYTFARDGRNLGLWTVSPEGGAPRALLEDKHRNITPSWSPDGKEVVFVSSRPWEGKRILGTGGLWKLRLGAAEPTLLLQEETLYHARPAWSPDGGKIVYVSFRGGSNQLWLLSPTAGNPLQLTFLNGEVFTPAWSPDNRSVAFISNSGGVFTLWTIPAAGGAPQQVELRSLKYRYPAGRLRVVVREAQSHQETAARVYLRGSDGKSYAPLGAFHRVSTITNDHYFHTPGSFTVELPAGRASVEVMKGFEHRPQKKEVEIVPGRTETLEFALERLVDMPAKGWYSGDNHLHMNYGGIFEGTPRSLLLEANSEDLHVTNDLVANMGNRIFDLKFFEGKLNSLSSPNRLLYFNEEYRPNFPGHMSLLNLKSYIFPAYVGDAGTARAADYPTNSQVLDAAHAQGAVGGYVHPFFVRKGEDPASQDYFGAREFPANVALGNVDYYDVMCIWSDEYVAAEVWYRLLNLGFKIPASAGTDAMTNYWRAPAIGTVRVYVHTGPDLTYEAWIRALTAGRTFVTDGPLLFLRVEGREPGEELRLPGSGPASVRVEAEAVSILPMQTLDILQNGRVVFSVKAEDPYRVKLSASVPVERSGWLAARVTGPEKQHLLMDSYVYAHTGPLYLRRGEQRARSPEDARYFLKWIDRALELMEKRNAFDTPAQKEEVFGLWRKARHVYAELAGDSPATGSQP